MRRTPGRPFLMLSSMLPVRKTSPSPFMSLRVSTSITLNSMDTKALGGYSVDFSSRAFELPEDRENLLYSTTIVPMDASPCVRVEHRSVGCEISGLTISWARTDRGAGILVTPSQIDPPTAFLTIQYNTICDNEASAVFGEVTDNSGGGALLWGAIFKSNLVCRNTADGDGGGIRAFGYCSLLDNTIEENVLWIGWWWSVAHRYRHTPGRNH